MTIQYDEALARDYIQKIRAGHEHFFSQLYDLTSIIVFRTVSLLIKRKEDASDIVQDIYIQLFSYQHHYDLSRSFKGWLLGIVYNQVASYRRKQWINFRLHNKVSKLYVANYDSSIDINISNKEQLEQWLDALPFKQRQIIVLKYYHDLTQEEIAQILRIPLGTVKSRLNSALNSLRRESINSVYLESVRSVK